MPRDDDELGLDADETLALDGELARDTSIRVREDETRPLDGPGLFVREESARQSGSTRGSTVRDRGDRRTGVDDDERIGHRIGRFVVLGTLGRGGMGTVYETFDRTLDRRVAVKVLHRDVDPQYQKQLIHEAKALAKLSHPNVVQVYEVGEIDHRSFVAMELVEGQTLRRWLKQEPPPDWRQCLEIFLAAGAGLAAAHGKGIVHCDFKPSNAIVDGEGRVRVLDFGLARATRGLPLGASRSSTELSLDSVARTATMGAPVVGTPAYMPLEQMEGQPVDARGDQFSFCVALFEAVYGERPFEGRSVEALKEARRAEVVASVPRDRAPAALHEAVLRGLSADPEHRWPTMQALLDRLEPLVVPPRRRRTLVVVSGAIAVGGALVGAGLAYQADMAKRCSGARAQLEGAWDDERRDGLEGAILDTELSYAADTWDRVGSSLDGYADAWVAMHTEVCEATSVRQEQSPAVMDLRMACLREGRVALRETVDVLAEEAAGRVAQAVTLVGSLPALSRCEDVETLQSERTKPEDPEVAEQVEALRDGLVEARALRNAGAFDDALARAEALVEQADVLGHAPVRAEALLERGVARREKAAYEGAVEDLEGAYLLAAELEHAGVEAEAVRELAFVVGHDQARHEEGLQWGKTALALARRPRADPREEATTLSLAGVILLKKGELDDALSYQRRALELFENALGPDEPDIADLLQNMGNVLLRQGKQEEALSRLQRARAIREAALGRGHPHVAHLLTAIGAVLIQQGEWDQALAHLQGALSIREEALGSDHPDVATSLNNVGAVLKQRGELSRALEHFQRSLAIQQELLGPDHPRVAYPLNNIGEVLREQGKLDEALTYLERATALSEKSLGERHPDVAMSMTNLASLLLRRERLEDAERYFTRALEIQDEALPPEHPHVASSLLGLAKIDLERERSRQARERAERALSIREAAKVDPVLLAEAQFVLARTLWAFPDDRARARELAQQARAGWSGADADDQQTKDYLAEVEGWLAEHSLPG